MQEVISEMKDKMESSLAATQREFSGLRTGRASTELVTPIMVDAYGAQMPLTQVSNVSTPGARTIAIQVWDKGLVSAVEKAIRESSLGLNPNVDGDTIRINMPELNEERRMDLIKVAKKYAETGRVAMRNARRDAMDVVKKMQKDSEISEDEERQAADEIQKVTDSFVAKVDDALANKEKDIMQV